MSILETVTRVREAEGEAGRILEAAHRDEEAAVTEALDQRRKLLADAKESARGSVLLIEKGLGKEKEGQRHLLASKVEKERSGLRESARKRSEEALREVLELFLSACRQDR